MAAMDCEMGAGDEYGSVSLAKPLRQWCPVHPFRLPSAHSPEISRLVLITMCPGFAKDRDDLVGLIRQRLCILELAVSGLKKPNGMARLAGRLFRRFIIIEHRSYFYT